MSLKYLNLTGLSRVITNLKNWVTSQIPTKTSEITNDSGFITSSSLPTVNNATLTIQKNGTNVQTFTANASSNKTANITVPTAVSELTNDSGFITSSSLPTVNNATLTIQKNGTTVKTFTANASSNVTCNITVPTKTSEITNDSGFLTSHQSLSNYSTLANTVKSLSISGKTITVTPGSGNAYTLTTQDTTYSNFVKSGSGAKAGLVPAPSTAAGTTKYLREDGTWQVPPDHTYTVNNATLTIQKNGSNVATFTSNASSNVTANITVPTKTSELTNDSGFLTSHQSLSGYLPLTGGVLTGGISRKHTDVTKGTNPSSVCYWPVYNCDKNGTNYKNDCLGLFETSLNTEGVVSTYIRAMKNTANNSSNVSLGVTYDTANNIGYTFAPTPAADADDTRIATTAWVRDRGYLTSHQSLSNYSTKANTVKSLSISGKTITVTPGSGNAYTLTTRDTVYTHPTTAGNKHIPSGGSTGQYLKYSSSGTATWDNLEFNSLGTITKADLTQNTTTWSHTVKTRVLCFLSCDCTTNTSGSCKFQVTGSNIFRLSLNTLVGNNNYKQDTVTYGGFLDQGSTGRARFVALFYPYSSSISFTIIASGVGTPNNSEQVTSFSMTLYQLT